MFLKSLMSSHSFLICVCSYLKSYLILALYLSVKTQSKEIKANPQLFIRYNMLIAFFYYIRDIQTNIFAPKMLSD